mgnify:FL=1
MNNMTETTAFGEAFLRDWYRKIDGKAPFSELARLTVGEGLVVEILVQPDVRVHVENLLRQKILQLFFVDPAIIRRDFK